MSKFVFCFLFFTISISLSAQQYTLPIQDQEGFLNETRTYIESGTLGALLPLTDSGKVRLGAGLRLGYSERNLTFKNDMIFDHSTGALAFRLNDDPAVEYPDRLLGRGYTRLRAEYFRIGASVGFLLGEVFQVSTGINVDFRVGSRYKNKSFVNGVKVVEKLKGNDILHLNGQQFSWVIQAGGAQGFSICYEMSLNNFFKDVWGMDYKFSGFGVVYGF